MQEKQQLSFVCQEKMVQMHDKIFAAITVILQLLAISVLWYLLINTDAHMQLC